MVPSVTSLGIYVAELAMSECVVAFVVQKANGILIRLPPFWDWPCAWHVQRYSPGELSTRCFALPVNIWVEEGQVNLGPLFVACRCCLISVWPVTVLPCRMFIILCSSNDGELVVMGFFMDLEISRMGVTSSFCATWGRA